MKWPRIIGQEHAKDLLIAAIKRRKVAHAYCIWGPSGVGKDALAIEFARVLNCMEPIETPTSIEACDRCRSCLQMSHLQHPHVQLVFSLPAVKAPNDDDSPLLRLSDDQIALIQEQLALKARNPYHDITIPNATQIRIAAIRDVRRALQLAAPVEHGWRVVIVSEADAMTIEAANAFLKTLEEPHARTTLVLTTSRREQLPPTILSRCQQIHCGLLSEEEIAAALVERNGIAADRARIIAVLAQGSYARALELAASGDNDDAIAQLPLDFLRAALKQGRYRTELVALVEHIAATLDRPNVVLMLRTLLAWLHDAYRLCTFGSQAQPHLIFQQGQAYTALERFVEHYRGANLRAAIAATESAIQAIEANAQVPLALISLVLRLRSAILQTHVPTPP